VVDAPGFFQNMFDRYEVNSIGVAGNAKGRDFLSRPYEEVAEARRHGLVLWNVAQRSA
jgi:hypothetical protein